MATFKHKDTGKRFLLIHIPRTGGRFIEANLAINGWEYETLELYGILIIIIPLQKIVR